MIRGSAAWEKYRDYLITTKQKSQKAHDDGILKVCGGSLGISFAFVNSFIQDSPVAVELLMLAWACWAVALVGVLGSHRYSTLAIDNAIKQLDRIINAPGVTNLKSGEVGGWRNRVVRGLNSIGWVLFASGVMLLGVFIYCNLRVRH